MTVAEAMAALEAAGSETIRAIYIRHGAGENQFGVKFGDLGKIRKQIGTDARLSAGLWATENSDARMLACMIADPKTMTICRTGRMGGNDRLLRPCRRVRAAGGAEVAATS